MNGWMAMRCDGKDTKEKREEEEEEEEEEGSEEECEEGRRKEGDGPSMLFDRPNTTYT